MGKIAKSSRKGKKAWRANISTQDLEEYFEKSIKDALSGGSLADIPSDSLYFVDKSRDLSVKRKIEKSRERVLHCDSVLQRNPFVQPVPSSVQKKKKSKKNGKAIQTDETDVDDYSKNETAADSGIVDLWAEKGEDGARIRRKPKPSLIPAVEVEPSGCSFNPHPDTHQEALARAVADEMHKIYRHELGPEPVPLLVPGQAIDEEDTYFLEADHGIDDDDDGHSKNIIDYEDTIPEKRSNTVELFYCVVTPRAKIPRTVHGLQFQEWYMVHTNDRAMSSMNEPIPHQNERYKRFDRYYSYQECASYFLDLIT